MALNPAAIQKQISDGLTAVSKGSADVGIEQLSALLTQVVIDAITSATITILPRVVIVAGSPTTQTNAAPIVVENGLT